MKGTQTTLSTVAFAIALLLVLPFFIAACSNPDHAGKTTTTTNGIALVLPSGQPAAHARIHMALAMPDSLGMIVNWDSLLVGKDGLLEWSSLSQIVSFAVYDSASQTGLIVYNLTTDSLPDTLVLAPLRIVEIQVAAGSFESLAGSTLALSDGFTRGVINENGLLLWSVAPVFGSQKVSSVLDVILLEKQQRVGTLTFSQDALELQAREIPMQLVISDTTSDVSAQSILWIDDFEDADSLPAAGFLPGQQPWWTFVRAATHIIPSSKRPIDFPEALVYDSTRDGLVFFGQYAPDSSSSWMALSVSTQDSAPTDMRTYDSLCMAYSANATVKVEWFRASDGDYRFYRNIAATDEMVGTTNGWVDTCVALSVFMPDVGVPTGFAQWATFADSISSFQILLTANGSYLKLDDLRLRTKATVK